MASKESAEKHALLAIDMYEEKIAKKTITAAEMSAYRALLKDRGWDRPIAETPAKPFTPPPTEDDEEDDRVIKFR